MADAREMKLRRRALRKIDKAGIPLAEVVADLIKLRDQLSLIEYAQDRDVITEISKKYGWEW